MFYAKITFILYTLRDGRVLEQKTVNGTGVQVGKAMGSYSENPSKKDYLATFKCEADDLGTSEIGINNLTLKEYNGVTNETEIPLKDLSEKDISAYNTSDIEEEYSVIQR